MKIYICGSHSAGKSTLARYISEKYKVLMLPEVARMILSERELQLDSLRHDLDLVDSYQTSVFDRQLMEEKKQSSFVSDRSLIDCLAYSANHSRQLNKLFNSKELKSYTESLKSKDSVVFFVRPSKATLKADGVREELNWDGIIQIDAMIKLLFQIFEIKYFSIHSDNMQERIQLIDSVINLHGG